MEHWGDGAKISAPNSREEKRAEDNKGQKHPLIGGAVQGKEGGKGFKARLGRVFVDHSQKKGQCEKPCFYSLGLFLYAFLTAQAFAADHGGKLLNGPKGADPKAVNVFTTEEDGQGQPHHHEVPADTLFDGRKVAEKNPGDLCDGEGAVVGESQS